MYSDVLGCSVTSVFTSKTLFQPHFITTFCFLHSCLLTGKTLTFNVLLDLFYPLGIYSGRYRYNGLLNYEFL